MKTRWTWLGFLIFAVGWFGSAWAGGRVDTVPERPAPGEVFAVRATGAGVGESSELVFAGRTFPLWRGADGTWHGLAGVDRDEKTGPKELLIVDRKAGEEGRVLMAEVTVVPRDYPEQRLTVNERMVTLSPEDQERAIREARTIREALAGRSGARLWEAPFMIPVQGPISSPFGVRRVYNGKPRGYHSGLDIAVPRGTEVRASAAGSVALVGEFFYTGNTIFLDHGLGLFTAYFHLDSVSVTGGQTVEAGDLVGHVGSTGRSTGPHLHWGVYLAGVKVDPLSLIRVVGGAVGGGESP